MHMLIFGSILFLSVVIARPFTDAFYYTKTIDFLRRAVRGVGCACALAEATLLGWLLYLCNALVELWNQLTILDDIFERVNAAITFICTALIAILLEKCRDSFATAS